MTRARDIENRIEKRFPVRFIPGIYSIDIIAPEESHISPPDTRYSRPVSRATAKRTANHKWRKKVGTVP